MSRNALTDVTVTRRRLCITSRFCKITKVLEPTLYFRYFAAELLGLCIVVRTAIAIVYGVMRPGGCDQDRAAFIEKTVAQKEGHHHIDEPAFQKASRIMAHIGG